MPENTWGQPIGEALSNWTARPRPPRTAMVGRYCRVEPLDPDRHAEDLFAANGLEPEGRDWTYMPYGPFASLEAYRDWIETDCLGDDPLFHAIVDTATGKAAGVASYLRIEPAVGCIEVGHIKLAPSLQRSRAATEAMYLMMARVFDDLGYRRYEWKCDALNRPSRKAAERLWFAFEGVFRQATIYKGRNRDTAWYSVIDADWPGIKGAFEKWLAPDNFEAESIQRRRLTDLLCL